MDKRRMTDLIGGVLLLLIGGLLLAGLWVPELQFVFDWPVTIIGVGVGLFLIGMVASVPGMAVPAFIVGGIGGILYYQNLTGDWDSWAYVWTLIPGFVGLGAAVSELIEGQGWDAIRDGLNMVLISIILFLVFGSAFGALGMVGQYWPALLIALGLIVLARAVLGRGEKEATKEE